MSKVFSSPIRTGAQVLTGSLVLIVGSATDDYAAAVTGAIPLGGLSVVRIQGTYARAGGSATGRPIFSVEVSMDSPDTAPGSVGHWVPAFLLDNSTFASGRIDGFAYLFSPAPTVAGTISTGTPPYDMSCAQWFRVKMADVDGAFPGTVSLLTFGGEGNP